MAKETPFGRSSSPYNEYKGPEDQPSFESDPFSSPLDKEPAAVRGLTYATYIPPGRSPGQQPQDGSDDDMLDLNQALDIGTLALSLGNKKDVTARQWDGAFEEMQRGIDEDKNRSAEERARQLKPAKRLPRETATQVPSPPPKDKQYNKLRPTKKLPHSEGRNVKPAVPPKDIVVTPQSKVDNGKGREIDKSEGPKSDRRVDQMWFARDSIIGPHNGTSDKSKEKHRKDKSSCP